MHFFNPLFRNEDESVGDYNRIWDFRAPKIDFLSLMGYNHEIGSTAFRLTRWMSTRKWHLLLYTSLDLLITDTKPTKWADSKHGGPSLSKIFVPVSKKPTMKIERANSTNYNI